jgi:hypothetical protein
MTTHNIQLRNINDLDLLIFLLSIESIHQTDEMRKSFDKISTMYILNDLLILDV